MVATTNKIARKGMVTVDQGEGYPFKSPGTNFVSRDLDTLQNWWATGRERRLEPVPRDENGQPMRLCSNGHYSPVRAFSRDCTRADGLDHYCKQCRKDAADRARATAKTQLA